MNINPVGPELSLNIFFRSVRFFFLQSLDIGYNNWITQIYLYCSNEVSVRTTNFRCNKHYAEADLRGGESRGLDLLPVPS